MELQELEGVLAALRAEGKTDDGTGIVCQFHADANIYATHAVTYDEERNLLTIDM